MHGAAPAGRRRGSMGVMSIDADRARDLLDALDILSRHRGVEPAAYRAVHAAATAAIERLHADLLDPRSGDFDSGIEVHTGLARRLRALPVPTRGQTSGGGSAVDPLLGLLARGARTSGSVDAVLGDVSRGMVPKVEKVVRDGLREVFTMLDRASTMGMPPSQRDDDPHDGHRDPHDQRQHDLHEEPEDGQDEQDPWA